MSNERKPWEETWEHRHSGEVFREVAEDRMEQVASFAAPIMNLLVSEATEMDEARAKLASAAPEIARLLLESWEYSEQCVGCGVFGANNRQAGGHRPDCKLVRALVKAGVLPATHDPETTTK